MPEWGYVKSGPATGSFTDVAEKASAGIDQISALVGDIRSGRGTMGKLFTEDTLHEELTTLLGAYEQVARNLNNPNGSIGRLTKDPTMARALEGSLQNLEAVTARIRAGEGSLGKLLNDDAMAKSVTSITANLDVMTGRLNRGEGTIGKLLTEKELYDRLNSMSDRFDKVAASLQQREGTMGLLLNDKQMYEKINATVDEVRGAGRRHQGGSEEIPQRARQHLLMSELYLGLIALGVIVMATIQVAAIVTAIRAARRVGEMAGRFEQDVRPILVNLQKVSEEAARASAQAAAQVDRLDALVSSVARRVEETAATLQQTILQPARDGLALLERPQERHRQLPRAARAASGRRRSRGAASPRPSRGAPRRPADDELFIG